MQIVGCKEALNIAKRQDWYKAYVRNTLSELSFLRMGDPEGEKENKQDCLKSLFFYEGTSSISAAFPWSGSPEGHDWWYKTAREFHKQDTRNFKYKKI